MSTATASAPVGISVDVTASQSNISDQSPIYVDVTYKNETARPITFLKWGTGLENTLTSDIFDIRFQGQTLDFSGIWSGQGLLLDSGIFAGRKGEGKEARRSEEFSRPKQAQGLGHKVRWAIG